MSPLPSAEWPQSRDDLIAAQERLGAAVLEPWRPPAGVPTIAACFVCFPRGYTGRGAAGDPAWAAAVSLRGRHRLDSATIEGVAGAPYEAGLLALREGPSLEAAVRALGVTPDVVLVNATGRDHPRRAGLALHLGAILDLPTIGITHRNFLADGPWPADQKGCASPLELDGEVVAHWLRTREGRRPVVVHAAWRTDPTNALEVARHAVVRARTPEALRQARRVARLARAAASQAARLRASSPNRHVSGAEASP